MTHPLQRLREACASRPAVTALEVGDVIVTNAGRKVIVRGEMLASGQAGVACKIRASRWIKTRQKFSDTVEWVYFNTYTKE